MSGVEWMGLFVAWTAVGMLIVAVVFGGNRRTPEEQALEDQGELRYLRETGFIQALDRAAENIGYRAAWEEAAEAGRQTRNIRRWTDEELVRATRLLTRYDR